MALITSTISSTILKFLSAPNSRSFPSSEYFDTEYDSVSKYSEDGKLLEFGGDNDFKVVEEMVNAINAIAPKKKPIDLKIN